MPINNNNSTDNSRFEIVLNQIKEIEAGNFDISETALDKDDELDKLEILLDNQLNSLTGYGIYLGISEEIT